MTGMLSSDWPTDWQFQLIVAVINNLMVAVLGCFIIRPEVLMGLSANPMKQLLQ